MWLLLACATSRPSFASGERVVQDTGTADSGSTVAPLELAPMVTLADGTGIDPVEVTLVDGLPVAALHVVPTTLVTWYDAVDACAADGRHLCTWEEWRDACDGTPGDGGSTFPWGDTPEPETICALADPDGTTTWSELQPTASLSECATSDGVYDQMGNAWEWVDLGRVDDSGVPVPGKVGGAWYAGHANARCDVDPMDEHPPDFRGTIGFRCCVAPGASAGSAE
jgi:hypothetical protein